jgi:hypothetical protein
MRRAEPLAGLGGLLLLVSLFLPWYRVEAQDFTAWQALAVIDVLVALLALPAILVPVLSLATRGPAKAIAIAVIASAIGWLAILLVAVRLIFPPHGLDLRYGAWVALAGALLAWVGSWLSMRDELTPGAVAPEIPRRPAPA